MQVFVLIDTDARVYGVVTNAEAAEGWLTFDGSFGFAECELDDYRSFNEALAAVEEFNSSSHRTVSASEERRHVTNGFAQEPA